MKSNMERYQVIALMRQGESQRSVVRQLGIHRNTVKKNLESIP